MWQQDQNQSPAASHGPSEAVHHVFVAAAAPPPPQHSRLGRQVAQQAQRADHEAQHGCRWEVEGGGRSRCVHSGSRPAQSLHAVSPTERSRQPPHGFSKGYTGT